MYFSFLKSSFTVIFLLFHFPQLLQSLNSKFDAEYHYPAQGGPHLLLFQFPHAWSFLDICFNRSLAEQYFDKNLINSLFCFVFCFLFCRKEGTNRRGRHSFCLVGRTVGLQNWGQYHMPCHSFGPEVLDCSAILELVGCKNPMFLHSPHLHLEYYLMLKFSTTQTPNLFIA